MSVVLSPRLSRIAQRGFTLVELMVSLAIGMVIALALLTLLTNVNRNNAELARTNSVIENGRFSLQLLETDVSHAGFWGGYVPTFDNLYPTQVEASGLAATPTAASAMTIILPGAVPDPCPNNGTAWTQPAAWSTDYKAQLVGVPVQVYSVPASGVSPACAGTASLQGPLYSNVQPSTDVLVVRHAAPCPASFSATDSDCQKTATNSAGDLFFQFSRCANDASTWALSTTPSDLALRDGKCSSSGTTPASPDYCFLNPVPDRCAPLFRFVSTIYWVRNYYISVGDGIPTLMRTRFQTSGGVLKHTGSEALVDGIEAFRVELGVDSTTKSGTTLTTASFTAAPSFASTTSTYTPTNRGDGTADTYIVCNTDTGGAGGTSRCSDPLYLANTVAVKLHVLVRASGVTPSLKDAPSTDISKQKKYTIAGTALGPFSDGYKRHVYTQAVRLQNVSMRREVPPGS